MKRLFEIWGQQGADETCVDDVPDMTEMAGFAQFMASQFTYMIFFE